MAAGGGDAVARATRQTTPSPPLKETVNGITYQMPYGRPRRLFAPAVQIGDLILRAGQTGSGAEGRVVPGGMGSGNRQALLNIQDVLDKSGSAMDRVVKCAVFLADMNEWHAMNGVYTTFFPVHSPARRAFGSTALALNARVEIACIGVAT
jgi:2-iminobutanoate/2-iminopropanoate deaminase